MTDTLSELDATSLLAAASGAVRERRLAEVLDLTPLAPKAVLHVHLHEAALIGADAVARVEGL